MPLSLSLSIANLLPIPLQERLSARSSQVWQTAQSWNGGDRVFIRAPSGTGKTTLIHILYGLRHDYAGRVQWGDADLKGRDTESLAQMRRTEVSIVFQDMRLFPELTAWENLELKRLLSNTISADRVREWMQRLGIADRADRSAATLSYGEQQRVAIIRALLQPFSWLLMDEPFSHLDIANAEIAATLISEVVAANGASLMLADLDENHHFPYTQTLAL